MEETGDVLLRDMEDADLPIFFEPGEQVADFALDKLGTDTWPGGHAM